MTNFPIPVLRLVEVIPVPVRDNCCGHIISDTPENESNKRNFEGDTPVLCSSRLTNTVGKVSGLHISFLKETVDGCVIVKNIAIIQSDL